MTITLCRYHYDPLDRLANSSPVDVESIQRFYQKNRLTTEIQGQIRRAIFQTEDHLLAQQQGPAGSALLATDAQRSVFHGLDATQQQAVAYSPYGTRQPHADPLGLLGFNGERADPVTGHYLLGNGYRAFNPVLMRFNSPDSLSPFGDGGLNAYAYCAGDPVNRVDPTGHRGVRLLVSIFKGRPRVLAKAAAKAKHPIALTADFFVEAKSIQGDVAYLVAQRVQEVKKAFKAHSPERVLNFKPDKYERYLSALKQANTLSPGEQIVKTLQALPLPPTPDGRMLRGPTRLSKAIKNSHAYAIPIQHPTRTQPSGISGLLPGKSPMQTLAEVDSIRHT